MTPSPCLYTALDSSLLAAAAYFTNETLQLEFRNGSIYRYFAVPPLVVHNLLAANSKGVYFNRHIRSSFRYQRLV